MYKPLANIKSGTQFMLRYTDIVSVTTTTLMSGRTYQSSAYDPDYSGTGK